MTVDDMLKAMIERGASDIHLQAGSAPAIRVNGELKFQPGPPLKPKDTEMAARHLLGDDRFEEFLYQNEMDFAYSLPGVARFRCNVMRQRGAIGLALRVVPVYIPNFEELKLPRSAMEQIANQERGLVIFTGPTGSGKSTSLAALLEYINQNSARNIVTIEDPIEFLHRNKRSLVVQREVGLDTASYEEGLRYVLRQDPDVIMLGEIRDFDSMDAALTAAQTGHLVLTTLHTLDATRTITRMIDLFPLNQHEQVRLLLSESLIAIVSQRLLPSATGSGRVLAYELLLNTPLVREYIRDADKFGKLREAMSEGGAIGMHTFEQNLVELYSEGLITLEDAESAATSANDLRLLLMRGMGKSF